MKPFLFAHMKISSLDFGDHLPVPERFSCKGPNFSPPLEFLDVPEDAKSLVLIVEDLDAPNHWIHWLVYNIPPNVTHFDEGKIPDSAIDGICNGGTRGYEGPCPKYFSGVHHYRFGLYALDCMLDVPNTADANAVRKAMEGHVLATAAITAITEGEKV